MYREYNRHLYISTIHIHVVYLCILCRFWLGHGLYNKSYKSIVQDFFLFCDSRARAIGDTVQ